MSYPPTDRRRGAYNPKEATRVGTAGDGNAPLYGIQGRGIPKLLNPPHLGERSPAVLGTHTTKGLPARVAHLTEGVSA